MKDEALKYFNPLNLYIDYKNKKLNFLNFHNDKPSLTNKSRLQNVTNFVKFLISYVYFTYK